MISGCFFFDKDACGACLCSLRRVTGVKRSPQTRVKIDLVHKTVSRQRAVSKLPLAFIGLPFPVAGGPADVRRELNAVTRTDRQPRVPTATGVEKVSTLQQDRGQAVIPTCIIF